MNSVSDVAIARDLQQAHALLTRGQAAGAIEICNRILARRPDVVDALHLLALAHKGQGDLQQAERLMLASIEKSPRRAEFRSNLGNLLFGAGRIADAQAAYQSALQLDPRLKAARIGFMRTLNATRRFAEAESLARALTATDDSDADAWVELASALKEQGRLDQAEAAYRSALERRSVFPFARHNFGALLSQMERADEALAELDRAAAEGVRGHPLHLNRAITLLQLGRLDEAEREFEAAARLADWHVETQVRLAKLRFMRGEDDFARSMRAVAEARPQDSALQIAYASLLRDAGKYAEATRAFEKAIATHGQDPALLIGLALTAMEEGAPERALDPARRAVQARPEYLHVSTCLQSVLLSLGRADEAMPLIREARRRLPRHQEHIACEATAARLLGDPLYTELYDYERFVVPLGMEPPPGYASIVDFNEELVTILRERQPFAMHPLDQSLRLGAQTPRNLLAEPHPMIQRFLGMLEAPIAEYRARLPRDSRHPLLSRNEGPTRLPGAWSVRLRKGGYHLNHVHPFGWLSSAYYVHVPADALDTERKSGWIKFGEPRYPVPGATPERIVQPRSGMLVLFPSYMWHGTMPITTDEPRVTIGFDVVPSREADQTPLSS